MYFFLISLLLFTNCYLASQGWGQLNILLKRQAIQDVLKKKDISAHVRNKLLFVEEVRRFSKTKIQLNVQNTYTDYSHLDRSILAWNVIASERLALKPKIWWFPIVGDIPYLGFFSIDDANEKANELEKKGWDVRVSPVAAYSTLGWFDDPLISTQLKYSDWYLASLLIHECSHATLWFSNDVRFNESFASFVGKEGALQFFRERYGHKKQRQIQAFLAKRKYKHHLYSIYTRRLQKLYASKKTEKEKLIQKKYLFTQLEKILIQNGYKSFSKKMNNVDLISFEHYHSGEGYFLKIFKKCNKNWKCFLDKMKALHSLTPKKRKTEWRLNS